MKIQKVHARQILDSRGNPTVEVDVFTKSSIGSAAVPSGASTGIHEAHELRDKKKSFHGKSVLKAIDNVNNKISKKLKGMEIDEQRTLDEAMIGLDRTNNKKRLGANAILGVSMAATRAGANSYRLHLHEYLGALYGNKEFVLPIPFANIINGGVHAGNDLKFQEFMIAPVKAKSFSEAVRIISEVYQELKHLLEETYGKHATSVGDEGGFAPPISTPEEAIDLIEAALEEAGHKRKVRIAIDAAASEFYDKKTEFYEVGNGKHYTASELVDYYESLVKKYKIISVEDPFHEDDFESFAALRGRLAGKAQVVGDDLTVTNSERIKKAIELGSCNVLLLKVNQIGTITEAMEAAHLAQTSNWKVMVSHRSGETEDPFIADLAVAINAGQIKLGAPARGERTSKYNQLLRIEESLGRKAKYAKF